MKKVGIPLPSKSIHRLLITWLLLIILSSFPYNLVSEQSAPSREYQIKAVFLFNFAKFVDWPEESFEHDSSAFIIQILGSDPFGNFMEETVANEYIDQHPIIIKRSQQVNDLTKSHILFISKSEFSDMNNILSFLEGTPTLTVGDFPDFTERGGMVRFITVNNKIKIRIDPQAAQIARLNVSSRLLSISEIVDRNER